MKLIVMKFGGTSVGSIDKINNVANIIERQLDDKKLIVVLSAMSGVTNKMQEYIDKIESNEICLLYTSPSPRDGIGSRMPSSA